MKLAAQIFAKIPKLLLRCSTRTLRAYILPSRFGLNKKNPTILYGICTRFFFRQRREKVLSTSIYYIVIILKDFLVHLQRRFSSNLNYIMLEYSNILIHKISETVKKYARVRTEILIFS